MAKKNKNTVEVREAPLVYTPEQMEQLGELELQRKAIEVAAREAEVMRDEAEIERHRAKTRTVEHKGGHGVSLTFYSVQMPDGTVKNVKGSPQLDVPEKRSWNPFKRR